MTATLPACVVDPSTAVTLFLPGDLSEHAVRLFSLCDADPPLRLHVPDLFFAECANVLWKAVRRLQLADTVARDGLEELLAMDLASIPIAALARDALRVALAQEISVYDACYVALADQLAVPLITADAHLVRRQRKSRHDIRWLRDAVAGG